MPRTTNARAVTVGTTSGSAALSGQSFDKSDKNRGITGPGIPPGTTVSTVTSPTAATMSANATATAASVQATIAAVTDGSLGFVGTSVESQDEANSYTVAAAIAGTVAPDRVTGPDQQSPITTNRRAR